MCPNYLLNLLFFFLFFYHLWGDKIKNKILFLIIITIFVSSLNFAFAEDNSTVIIQSEINTNTSDVIEQIQHTSSVQSIKVNGVVNRVKGGVYYSATFYDITGTLLKNQEIFFAVDSNDLGFPITTDSNGVGLLKVALKNGNHKIISYNYATGENVSDTFKVFDVLTGGKDIKMYYDNGNTYKLRVFDNNGNPVKAGQKVTFNFNGKKSTVKTDKNGYATFKLTQKPGYYPIFAQYNNFQVANMIYIKNVLKLAYSFKNSPVKAVMKVKIKFLGKSKKNKLIKVKFNKKTYKAKTNKKGIATFKVKSPKKIGKYSLTVIYKKNKLSLIYTKYRV